MKPRRVLLVVSISFITFAAAGVRLPDCGGVIGIVSGSAGNGAAAAQAASNPSASARAFVKASQVLLHPRCVNCHPAGEQPLQGDESRPHAMNVRRGVAGLGNNGLWCSTCHQDKNLPEAHMPPGAPGWQLPPEDMPMAFEKKTPRELCLQLKDPARNGGRSPEEVLEHVETGAVVLWGWNPGEGRTPPPMSHAEFVKNMTDWVRNGAACPE